MFHRIVIATVPHRHCERSEAIYATAKKKDWIASSQVLLAMTVVSSISSP
jgi:hypothetical protein